MKHFQYDDIPTHGHMKLQKQRQLLGYYRLLKNEFPQLHELAEPFQPPPAQNILQFTFTHYQGEEHPNARKVVLHVNVEDLAKVHALDTTYAKHKFLLLAGSRWQPTSPALVGRLNAALAQSKEALDAAYNAEPLGVVTIASTAYPHEPQNMKWCSDVLDRMIEEANKEPSFADIPLDVRPYIKSNARGGQTLRPTVSDFPAEWL
ncbi:37S ribosomal protein S24, mitochondrial [Malassezia vespertilionis]|nr:37S ribosomal protein S24, mitochondrial [Malassezia vespertilionis]WFD07506.1 37S ribosomal protein S24, mitochondrial [Malassezia vespertilionis]